MLPLNCLLSPLPLPATVNKDMVFAFKSSQQKSVRDAAWELFLSSQSQTGLRGTSNLDAGFVEWSLEFLPHDIGTIKNFLYTLDWLQMWPQAYFTVLCPHPLYHNYSFYYQEETPISLPLEFRLVLFTSVSNKMHQKRWCDIQGVRQRNLDSSDVSWNSEISVKINLH